jgi:hypothetical protein
VTSVTTVTPPGFPFRSNNNTALTKPPVRATARSRNSRQGRGSSGPAAKGTHLARSRSRAAQLTSPSRPAAQIPRPVSASSGSLMNDDLHQLHPFLQASPNMLQVEQSALKAARARRAGKEAAARTAGAGAPGVAAAASRDANVASSSHGSSAWHSLRREHLWPDNQGNVFESMYSPYQVEGIGRCWQCLPDLG